MQTFTCDLYNPTTAPRVIFDGVTNTKPIRIAAKESREGVVLADHVVNRLKRQAALGDGVDLKVTVHGPASKAEKAPTLTAEASGPVDGQYMKPVEPETPDPMAKVNEGLAKRAAGGKGKKK